MPNDIYYSFTIIKPWVIFISCRQTVNLLSFLHRLDLFIPIILPYSGPFCAVNRPNIIKIKCYICNNIESIKADYQSEERRAEMRNLLQKKTAGVKVSFHWRYKL